MPSKPAAHSRVPYSEEKWYIHSKITHEGKERVKPVGAAVTVDVRWNRQGGRVTVRISLFLAA
jgi:putative transposon-encoded protein